MESAEKTKLTVNTLVDAPVEKAWNYFTTPMHILHWYAASDEWHTSKAENDLQVGGRFMFRMEARDGSFGFDYSGEYIKVVPQEELQFKLDDDRLVKVTFTATENGTKVLEDFEAENTFSADMQLTGWQAILDNFKKHVETFKLQQLHAQIMINAPVEKVYQTMLDEQQYQDWTVAFNASSHFIGTWEKGSKMIFLGIDDQGNKIGVVSRIKEHVPNQYLSIEHIGVYKEDQEVTTGPDVEGWAGSLENYTFSKVGDQTLVQVDMDANDDFKMYFEETWPKALNRLKVICES